MEKLITYQGKEASESYKKVMQIVKEQGYETFHEYLVDKKIIVIKDEWRVKTRYEALPDDAQSIPQCPGYYATPEGEIWKHSPKLKCWLKLAQQKHKSGYLAVQVYLDGKRKVKYVHRLVCSAFYGDMGTKFEVHHIDADRWNNHIDNLQWLARDEHRAMPRSKWYGNDWRR